MIEGVLTDIQERINNKALSGVDYDDEIEGEDEALESIPFIIEKKLSHWSERIHFPVAILPLYIAGVILSRITCPTPLPLWADLCFVLVELLLMRISYKDLEYTHVMVAWLITVFLFLGCFSSLLGPLMVKLFLNTDRPIAEPWVLRVSAIIVAVIIILRDKLKS